MHIAVVTYSLVRLNFRRFKDMDRVAFDVTGSTAMPHTGSRVWPGALADMRLFDSESFAAGAQQQAF
jgi:hypothetical protein